MRRRWILVRIFGPAWRLTILAGLVSVVVAVFVSSALSGVVAPPYTVAVSPGSVVAGSSGNALAFAFKAVSQTDAQVSVVVPAVTSGGSWSKPQSTTPSGAGYVQASRQNCASASVASVSGPAGGPWTILVDAKCGPNKGFSLVYGAGGPRVTAATLVGSYTFAASAKAGKTTVPLAAQPAVSVVAGSAATLSLTGASFSTAGDVGSPTVTLRDAFGNQATGYRGRVHFSSPDPQAVLPSDYTFTTSDAGTHTFTNAVTLKTAALVQTLRVTDTATSALTDSGSLTIEPGNATHLVMSGLISAVAHTPQSLTVTARDAYGNTASSYSGTVHFTGGPTAFLPPDYTFTTSGSAYVGCFPQACDQGTHTWSRSGDPGSPTLDAAGTWTIAATDTATSTITGSQTVTISHGPLDHFNVTHTDSGLPNLAGAQLIVGQIIKIHADVTAVDAENNLVPDENEPLTLTLSGSGIASPGRVLSGQMTNGLASFDTVYTIPATVGSFELNAADSGGVIGGIGEVFTGSAAVPDVSVVRLLNPPVINVPDPLYVPSLNMQIDPTSLTVTAGAVITTSGSLSIPVQAVTLGGDDVTFTATTSTPVDPLTGNLTLSAASLPQRGTQLQVYSCTQLPTTFDISGSTLPAFNFGDGTCSGGFQPATSVAPGVNTLLPFVQTTGGVAGVQSIAFSGIFEITAPECAAAGEFWNTNTLVCEPTG
jgi:hypothetical protein